MIRSKQIGDCPILAVECLAAEKAILMVIQKDIQPMIIQSDSQLVVNSINRKIEVPKIIINLGRMVMFISSF